MSSKIYTKTGDKGTTSLIGGTKVVKSHLRIESYGTVDELNSFIGLLADQLNLAVAPAATPAVPTTMPAASNATGASNASAAWPASESPAPPASTPTTPPALTSVPPATTTPTTTTPAGSNAPSTSSPAGFNSEISALREIQDRLFTIGSSLACDPEKEPKMKIPDLKESDIEWLEKGIDAMDDELPSMKSFLLPGGHVAVSTAHVARCVCRRAERACVRLQEEGLYVEGIVIRYLNRLSDYLFELSRYIAHRLQAPEIPWRPRV